LATILIYIPLLLPVMAAVPPADRPSVMLIAEAADAETLDGFTARVNQYVALHRRLERAVGADERVFDDWGQMLHARQALAAALREARPNARRGDIFNPAVAALFRTRINETLLVSGVTVGTVLDAIHEDAEGDAAPLEVNAPFPWESVGSAMWPALLRVLPRLPPELEYRFVDATLVLIDTHANLVVDMLEDALPGE
jgi:hypothetical protein